MMKKSKLRVIVFTIIALSVVLGNSGLAEAEDMKITGQIRHRTERNDKDFSDETASYGFSFLRSRMNLKFTNENTYAFIQIQDSRIFGTETNTLSDGSADALDFHQAYFALSDFVTKGLTVMVGRREIAYANQRLMGSVGWHNIGRSFDGATFRYTGEKYKADLFLLKETEMSAIEDVGDKDVRGIWVETSFAPTTRVDVFVINQRLAPGDVLNRNTFGLYSKGKYDLGTFTLSQETDLALQSGKNGGNDVSASLFGTRIKFAAKDAAYKYWVGVGYDVVSGDDTTTPEDEAFNTLYATNHKYYGFMDYFLNIQVHSQGAGLTDLVISGGFAPKAKLSLKADYHLLSTSQEVASGSTIGTELDLTVVYGYSSSLKIVGGASMFTAGDVFKAWKGEDNSSWGYLMTIYNF